MKLSQLARFDINHIFFWHVSRRKNFDFIKPHNCCKIPKILLSHWCVHHMTLCRMTVRV